MTDSDRVQAAVDDFLEFLRSVPRVGVVDREVQLSQLRVLVHLYPGDARRMLDEPTEE